MVEASPSNNLSAFPSRAHSVLLIDDDVELCTLMGEYFRRQGYSLECAHNGRDGLTNALAGKHALVILDVMLPGLDGLEVLRQIRKRRSVPIIMLTARTQERDRVTGLDSGADDYLPKPFSPDELMARIRAVLRRFGLTQGQHQAIATIGNIEIDLRARQVWCAGRPVELTETEFEIFTILVHSAGRIVTRDEITSALHQRESTPYERSLDVHMSHLRKKLERGGTLIHTVRGLGYMLAPGERQK